MNHLWWQLLSGGLLTAFIGWAMAFYGGWSDRVVWQCTAVGGRWIAMTGALMVALGIGTMVLTLVVCSTRPL
jgi:hypothetical protein